MQGLKGFLFYSMLISLMVTHINMGNARERHFSEGPQSWIRVNQLGYLPGGIKVAVWGLLNNVKPTSERSFIDKTANSLKPIPSALATFSYNELKNYFNR
jgi:hypothetical protein